MFLLLVGIHLKQHKHHYLLVFIPLLCHVGPHLCKPPQGIRRAAILISNLRDLFELD
jgi:hypothetical protein